MPRALAKVIDFGTLSVMESKTIEHGLDATPTYFRRITDGTMHVEMNAETVTVVNVGESADSCEVYVEYAPTRDLETGGLAAAIRNYRNPEHSAIEIGPRYEERTHKEHLVIRLGIGSTKPTEQESGLALSYLMGVGDFIYSDVAIPHPVDRRFPPTIEVEWAPSGDETDKTVSWRLNIISNVVGDTLDGATGTQVDLVDLDVPTTSGEIVHSRFVVPISAFVEDSHEFHMRIGRVASTADPLSNPAIYHLEATYQYVD